MKLFELGVDAVVSIINGVLQPDEVVLRVASQPGLLHPSWCECTVPSATTFACSLVYTNGPIVTVVPAQ